MAIFTRSKLLFLFFLIFSLFLASQCDDQNPWGRSARDPRRELESCLRQCQAEGERPEQQLQCQRSCVLRYERQQKERSEGEGVEDELTQHRDPQEKFRECQQRCERQQQGQQKQLCRQRCEQEYQKEREQQEHGRGETGEDNQEKRGPEKRLKKCQKQCKKQPGPQQIQCQQRCQQQYQKEREQQPPGVEETNPQREEQQEENVPYLFKSQRFKSRFRASHGDFRILEKFTKRSQLLRGIEKFRVFVIELEPQSFMLPHHCDGEAIFVVVRGQGTINIAEQDDKNSFNLETGDVLRLRSGSTIYLLNRDNNEKLFVYVLARSVNAPGQVQEYFSAGGENPESFYRAFSSEILETAFNIPRDRLERLFGQQKQGAIIKASEEQIRAISEHASRSTKQTKGQTQGPFNLLKERPLFESRFGQFIEASPEKFEQLMELDSAVAFMNINQGGMVIPYYNSRSTRVVMVVEGNARFEMACPHLGRQGRGQGSRGERGEQEQEQEEDVGDVHYQKVRGNLNVGDVLVVPAGHPITFIATGGSNFRIVGFGIHAMFNKKNFLAGQQSIWRNVEREAKELSFNMPGREVEEIFQKQDQSYFVAGPEHRQQHGERGEEEGRRGQDQYLSSILDFVF